MTLPQLSTGVLSSLIWNAGRWPAVAAAAGALVLLLIVWGYWRTGRDKWVRLLAPALKILGVALLALCLLEPLFSRTRARPGANLFIVLTDNSQSMTLRDRGAAQTRAQELKALASKPTGQWLARIGEVFDLRQYAFDTQLRSAPEIASLPFDGSASNLGASLQRLVQQYQDRPLAGIVLLTDGGATDPEAVDRLLARPGLPPIYPVLLGGQAPADDINLQGITVSQTNFEDAPVTLSAQVSSSGYIGQSLTAQLLDESGRSIEEQRVKVDRDGEPLIVRFRLRPEQAGLSFYRVRVAAEGQLAKLDDPAQATEATIANNSRLVAVDRGKGPYRILYVAGRPNWEFKFLQRALQSDEQVQLVGLLRIAKREPKFNYISHVGESSNPLFRGFEGTDKEQVEQYDQPVLVRFGTQDQAELRGGFPKTAEELYKYHAIVIDDLESEFFTQDQMLLLKEFVRQRGGGLLMLGGVESFRNGKYDRTPLGDLLPVYVDGPSAEQQPARRYRLSLTREGWLEPWVRLRADELSERRRMDQMPPFLTVNGVRAIKPGATVLANVNVDDSDVVIPALVEQRFGHGRAAAMLIGDLWRWSLRRPADAEDDMPKAWRQTIRWLVSDVPQRLDVAVAPGRDADDADGSLRVTARVRDPAYAPLDNAAVTVRVTTPDGHTVDLPAEPSAGEAGLYEAAYVPRLSGAYRAQVTAAAPDGSEVAKVQAGWTSEPAADEFRDLRPNRELLDRIASATGGQRVAPAELESFATSLPTRRAQITDAEITPAWQQPWVILLAIACLAGEWGLRRWKGLP